MKVAMQTSQPIFFFFLLSFCLFVSRGRVNKEPVPVQSLRDLMQEEEQKTNVPTPTPRNPIASGKSGSARKKLKYSTRFTRSFVILSPRLLYTISRTAAIEQSRQPYE